MNSTGKDGTPTTDLALEAAERLRGERRGDVPGVTVDELTVEGIAVTRVTVTDQGSQNIGKAPGTYVTVEAPELKQRNPTYSQQVSKVIARELERMLPVPRDAEVLVVGLGNWRAIADSLGPRVASKVYVTRHLGQFLPPDLVAGLRPVSSLSPGVLGITGIETTEVVHGVVEHVKPGALVAVDALAAMDVGRIMTTVQIADSGIHPGSGLGTKRLGLTRQTLGIPVVAVGVPTVVHAVTIAANTIDLLVRTMARQVEYMRFMQPMAAINKRDLIQDVLGDVVGNLVVTPKEIDIEIEEMAKVIAGGLNAALHPGIEETEIMDYIR
ncbi:MAG: GPR endopeptidase [Firmicutes bacterium]|jgi:spore protease|nr:GPR endopeptidase [Bacillota bacterium]